MKKTIIVNAHYEETLNSFELVTDFPPSTDLLECIYNPITAMGFLAMFTFQLDSTKR
jgi:hypothetical protein